MRTVEVDVGDAQLRRLITTAQVEPVTVLDKGQPAIVMLSPEEFARLDEQDRIRREAKARLRKTMAIMQAEAASQGLTETELDRLLADES